MGLDFLQKLLAGIIDKFKTSNPVLFVVVVAVLTGLKVVVEANLIPLKPEILDWVLWVIALFVGSRTTSFLKEPDTDK